jgi:hypothetical protein
MSTVSKIKNLIRRGKEERLVKSHSQPRTTISTMHPDHNSLPVGIVYSGHDASGASDCGYAQMALQKPLYHFAHERSVTIKNPGAEETAKQSKLPLYPGLERWILVEEIGDGAFSNVYRARDSTTHNEDVAIKVVRKCMLNNIQVRRPPCLFLPF